MESLRLQLIGLGRVLCPSRVMRIAALYLNTDDNVINKKAVYTVYHPTQYRLAGGCYIAEQKVLFEILRMT